MRCHEIQVKRSKAEVTICDVKVSEDERWDAEKFLEDKKEEYKSEWE